MVSEDYSASNLVTLCYAMVCYNRMYVRRFQTYTKTAQTLRLVVFVAFVN